MKNLQRRHFVLLTLLAGVSMIGCKPKTVPEKIEDKAEDAAHEIRQGTERAGEKVEDATSK